MFGNEPSPTLALQLLKRATERARETGGQPTKAVRRLWKIVRQDGRVVAALGEMADSPEALAEWLALTGGDHELERMLGDSNEIAADDAPLVQHVVGGSLRKRGETMKPRKMQKWTERAMEAGLNWSTMSPQEQDAFRQMFKQTQKVVKTRRRAMRAADDRALVAAAASDDPVVAAKARTALEKGRNAAVGAALALPGHSHTQAENFGVPGYRPKQP